MVQLNAIVIIIVITETLGIEGAVISRIVAVVTNDICTVGLRRSCRCQSISRQLCLAQAAQVGGSQPDTVSFIMLAGEQDGRII